MIGLLEALARSTIVAPGLSRIRVSRDPEDDKLLVAAIEGGATRVVTGDRDLLALGHHRGVRPVRPAAFLATPRSR
jgi:putative PIN family toxin of toxin-antitoxin system